MGRILGVVCASVCVLIGGGSVFGFSALQQTLLNERVFAFLCGAGVSSPCDAEIERMTLLFSLSIGLLYVAVFPFGFVIDLLGAAFVMMFGAVFACAAFVVVAIFPRESLAWSLAIPLLGICSPALFMSALVFPRFLSHSSSWTMLVISSFDVGSGVFLGLLLVPMHDRNVFLGVLGGATLLFGAIAAWSLPSVGDVRDLQDKESHFEVTESTAQSLKKVDFWAATFFIAVWSMKNRFLYFFRKGKFFLLSRSPSPLSFYLASFETVWRLFDAESAGTAVFVLNCAMPVAGLLALPLGMVLFKLPVFGVFFVVVAIGLAYSVCQFFYNSIVQYVGVVFYAFMRPLKWSVVSFYILSTFPLTNVGRLFGVLNLVFFSLFI